MPDYESLARRARNMADAAITHGSPVAAREWIEVAEAADRADWAPVVAGKAAEKPVEVTCEIHIDGAATAKQVRDETEQALQRIGFHRGGVVHGNRAEPVPSEQP